MARHDRRTGRAVAAAVLAAALTAGLAACGTGTNPGGNAGGTGGAGSADGLSAALDGVPADAGDETLTYVDVREARRLLGADRELYGSLDGFGIPELAQARYDGGSPRAAHGFDAADVETSVHITPGAGRLTGRFDVAAVTTALTKRGWKEERTEGGALLSDGPARTAVSEGVRSFTAGPENALPPLAAPERSVADDPAYRSVVRCLGEDVFTATFYGTRPDRNLPGLTLFAIGARAGADGSSRERLCALTASAEGARRVTDTLKPRTAGGERFAGATLRTGGGPAPMVTMEWANRAGSGLRPGDQNRTGELPRLLVPPR
jgi:hypothetical protein